MSEIDNLETKVENLQINGNGIQKNGNVNAGLSLDEIYKLGLNFFKEKGGKAFHFSYEDNLQLIAFSQQVTHGPLNDVINKLPPLGPLDVVGKDRREAWQKLGQLSNDQAKAGFVELLSRRCPLFTAFTEAHRREKDEQKRKEIEESSKRIADEEEQKRRDQQEQLAIEHMQKEETIKRQIQQALNEQTYDQFRKYAEEQYPGDPEKQGNLVRQLQDQHYLQYMHQLERSHRSSKFNEDNEFESSSKVQAENGTSDTETETKDDEVESIDTTLQDDYDGTIQPASMWTLGGINEFKQSVSHTEGDCVIRVGHGETITVRVPTHPDGSRLFWEFATDHYDIGFGVYFEFGTPTTDEVSVNVSESDDEEPDVEELCEDLSRRDIEAGDVNLSDIVKRTVVEIVAVYRRDCQSEVYAGSHTYPGSGIYLLKFDNSYSLWRSKTLYYRVYYTQ